MDVMHTMEPPADFTNWECLEVSWEASGDVLLVAHPDADVEVWVDAEVHGELHDHHPCGVAYYPQAIAFPVLPGPIRVWVPGGECLARGLLIDTAPGNASPIKKWIRGPELPPTTTWTIGTPGDPSDSHLHLNWKYPHKVESWVGWDAQWDEPRTLLLTPTST